MEPTFYDGQYLIIDEISYRFQPIKRGDVVVFRYPFNPREYYIKRVIGLPGETVEVVGGGVIIYNDQYPNGKVLNEEEYLPPNEKTLGNLKVTLGEGEYFVLGDNRSASSDSRKWGVLPEEDIIGKVWIRAWPLETAEVFAAPSY